MAITFPRPRDCEPFAWGLSGADPIEIWERFSPAYEAQLERLVTVLAELGFCPTMPCDRDGSFGPELVKKGQTRIDGMDDKIIVLYAAGLMVRDIRTDLEEVFGQQVSPDLISRVSDRVSEAVLDEVREWQSRALEWMYPIIIWTLCESKSVTLIAS